MNSANSVKVMALLAAATIPGSSPSFAGTADLLPPPGSYQTPAAVHACFAANPQHPDVCLLSGNHTGFIHDVNAFGVALPGGGSGEQEHFDSSFTGQVFVNGAFFSPISMTGPVTIDIFNRTGPYQAGTFSTEMTQLDLTGTIPIGPLMIRESPTLSSTGTTTITPNPNGSFHIDSFFDIFTELSVDGGATWEPQNSPATHVVLNGGAGADEFAPEPGSALLIGAGLVLLGAKLRKHRRQ